MSCARVECTGGGDGESMMERADPPDFDRFLAAIKGGHADRVPVAEALVDNGIKAAVLGRPVLNLEDDVAFWAKAGYDFICLPSGLLDPGQTVDGDRPLGSREDSYGPAAGQVKWASEGQGVIRSIGDVEAYPWPSVEQLIPDHLSEVAPMLPDGMKVVVTTGKVFTAAWQLMGFESFCFAVYDKPALVETLLKRIARLQLAAYERICEIDSVGGFWFSDDMAHADGMMVSPEILRRHVFPWYAEMVRLAHHHGKIAIFHSDGRLWRVMEDILACGFDALHPIEPKAMDIEDVRERTEGRIALIGNIDLDYPLTTGTPEAVRAQVRERIAALAPDGGYLVGSSNSIPGWVPVPNYLAMLQATFDYGTYPVNLA
ncbi:MAG TPA: uroporphyrinogen decarboxylase family protein [Anaerolineae bacterium]|nr:uroporphyrinogen decarboxylase family protein [Anaerolineae bacterium]